MDVSEIAILIFFNSERVDRFCGKIQIPKFLTRGRWMSRSSCGRTDRRTGIARVTFACKKKTAFVRMRLEKNETVD